MKNPLKIVKRISKILSWLVILVRILVAIKKVLGDNNPDPSDIVEDNKP